MKIDLKEETMFIKISDKVNAEIFAELLGWESFEAFENKTGVIFKDIKDSYFEIADFKVEDVKTYKYSDLVKNEDNKVIELVGNPQRVFITSIKEHLGEK